MVEQTTETPATSLDEETMEHTTQPVQETVEMPQVQFLDRVRGRIVEQTDVPVPHMMEKTIEVMKHNPQKHVQNHTVEQIMDMPVVVQRQVQKTVEVPQIQFIDKAVDVPVIVQRQVPIVRKVQKTVEVPQAQSTDEVMDAPVILQRHVPAVQVAQKTVKDPQTQSIVKELRSKFEVGHTKVTEKNVHGRNRSDKGRWIKKQGLEAKQYPQYVQERADLTNQRQVPAIRSVQKTVEVPRVQYIDKVADIPVDM